MLFPVLLQEFTDQAVTRGFLLTEITAIDICRIKNQD